MSEDEGFFEEGSDHCSGSGGGSGSGSEGGGGGDGGCLGKMCSAMAMSIIGCVLLPSALFLCGWNEKNYVCVQKNILDAETNAMEFTDCSKVQGGYVSFNCPIDPKTRRTFTGLDFDRQDTLEFTGLSAKRDTEAFWCVEKSREVSNRRLEESERRLLSPRRLSSERRLKKSKSTHTEYYYQMEWTTTAQTPSEFKDQSKAYAQCRGLATVAPPTNLGTSDLKYAALIKAGTGTVKYQMNPDFHQDFVPDTPVDLSDNSDNLVKATPSAGRFKTGQYFYSCNPAGAYTPTYAPTTAQPGAPSPTDAPSTAAPTEAPTEAPTAAPARLLSQPNGQPGAPFPLGCTRDSYTVNDASRVAAIVEATKSTGMTEKHPTASSWGCSAGTWYKVIPTNDAKLDKATIIDKAHEENNTQVMILRIVGVLGAWAAVYCLLYPLVAMADVMGDCLDMILCIGDMLESLLEGVVTCVVCAVSCSTGCACALFVVAVVWIFMRPLYGAVLMAICITLCVCSYCVLDNQRDPEKKSKRKKKKSKKSREFMDEDDFDAEE
jgi:hypothetical protein